jgi:hypothetical protein
VGGGGPPSSLYIVLQPFPRCFKHTAYLKYCPGRHDCGTPTTFGVGAKTKEVKITLEFNISLLTLDDTMQQHKCSDLLEIYQETGVEFASALRQHLTCRSLRSVSRAIFSRRSIVRRCACPCRL